MVLELMKHQLVDVNAKDDNGKTALILSSERYNLGLIGALLKHQELDINAWNEDGATALHVASDAGHWDVVCKLLNRNISGSTTVNVSVVADDDCVEVVDFLDRNCYSDVSLSVPKVIR